MAKSHLKLIVPTTEKRTVTPRRLPKFLEPRRNEIEAALPALDTVG